MALIQISNQSTKNLGKKSTIRFTQSICPDCNMILDAEVFERDNKVYMSKVCPTHGECEELYFGSYEMYKKFSTYWICLLYTSPSPRDGLLSRMPSSA